VRVSEGRGPGSIRDADTKPNFAAVALLPGHSFHVEMPPSLSFLSLSLMKIRSKIYIVY
jgi:hypothetical protein